MAILNQVQDDITFVVRYDFSWCRKKLRFRLVHIFFLVIGLSLSGLIRAQTFSASDSLFLANLKTQLVLNDSQYVAIDSIYRASQVKIVKLEKEIQSISRSDIAEELKTEKTSALAAEKKKIREVRDLDIQLQLTEEQKNLYAEKIRVTNPAVSHFGINHDRANCNVCITPPKP